MASKDTFAKIKNIAARYMVATIGLAFVAIGIAFAVLSNLGVSALNGVQYAFACKFPRFSFGDFNFGIFSLFIFVQLAVLKKQFKVIDLLQLVANFLLGYMVDNFSWSLDWLLNHIAYISPDGASSATVMSAVGDSWDLRFFLLACSCFFTAFGVSLEVAAKAWMLPAEMTVSAFTRAFGGKFSTNKVIMDSSLLVISVILCLVFFGNMLGPEGRYIIGWGTLISAVAIGFIMRLTDPLVSKFIHFD